MSREMQNLPSVRPANILVASSTCPIPLGQQGHWLDSADSQVKLRLADGTDSVLGGSASLATIAVDLVATAALASNVYANGTAGVGATLTASANGAMANIDGTAPTAGKVVLVNAEGTGSHNGPYTVTSVGGVSSKWKLTRLPAFDESVEMNKGTQFAVASGSTYANSLWKYSGASAPTVGTTSLTFVQDTSNLLGISAFRSLGAGAPATVFTGHNGAGAVTLTGAKVGDKVILLVNLTDAADGSGSFESTITVANQIQQSSVSDLSAKKFSVLLLAQS